ncbi:hypothetical protein GDO81_026241 [Engystomops pustulosus]|uniref:Uncharacterized protein n=1 Tax=Engystomops pustulosus TaxID=76066 RepID=A0AAV6YK76_ENGPU|nr:hypothetical protein GDO81_026241 [Engystomops pustulosus]
MIRKFGQNLSLQTSRFYPRLHEQNLNTITNFLNYINNSQEGTADLFLQHTLSRPVSVGHRTSDPLPKSSSTYYYIWTCKAKYIISHKEMTLPSPFQPVKQNYSQGRQK